MRHHMCFLSIGLLLLVGCGHPTSIKELSHLQLNYWNKARDQFEERKTKVNEFLVQYEQDAKTRLDKIEGFKQERVKVLAETDFAAMPSGSSTSDTKRLIAYLYRRIYPRLQQKSSEEAILQEVESDIKTLKDLDTATEDAGKQIAENQKVINDYLAQNKGFKLKDVYKYVTNSEALKSLLKGIFERIRKRI